MAGTRSSARLNSSSPQSAKDTAGTKRKADETNASPSGNKAKRGRPSKEQKTLHETMPTEDDAENAKMTDAAAENVDEGDAKEDKVNREPEAKAAEDAVEDDQSIEKQINGDADNAKPDSKDDAKAVDQSAEKTTNGPADKSEAKVGDDAVEKDKKREEAMPSNILEKGIIYFFARGRVGVDNPDSVQDLARSYFVLRPLPDGAKLTDGTIQDVGNNRLLALPKKVWPKSGKDRFMVFVEKADTSMETLKEEFFQGSEYSTKTAGVRSMPEVTPLGEGVYAMTSTGGGQGTTHLAYMLTIPSEIGEVQKDVGLAEKGSFVLSLKNPEAGGPANAQLDQSPEYPKEIIDEFRGRSWMPLHPKHLNYANAQMLLIGEDFDSSSNLDAAPKDEKDDSKETPQEELEKLENEDELRVENLKGDDTIFADLGISRDEYPKVMTTW